MTGLDPWIELCDVIEHLGHLDSIVLSLACILMKQHDVRSGKYLLETPGNAISKTLIFKMSLDASALKQLVPLVWVPKPRTTHYQPAK